MITVCSGMITWKSLLRWLPLHGRIGGCNLEAGGCRAPQSVWHRGLFLMKKDGFPPLIFIKFLGVQKTNTTKQKGKHKNYIFSVPI
jgi:hypothetical protein